MVIFVQKIFSNSTNVFMKKSFTETATGGVVWKELFLKISQYSQEKICVGVSFLIKLLTLLTLTNFIKMRLTTTQVFSCGYCKIFKNTYFEEHLRTAVFALNTFFCKYEKSLNIKMSLQNFANRQIWGCWFQIWQYLFKILAKNYPNKTLLVPNLGTFVFSGNIANWQIWGWWFQIWQ